MTLKRGKKTSYKRSTLIKNINQVQEFFLLENCFLISLLIKYYLGL